MTIVLVHLLVIVIRIRGFPTLEKKEEKIGFYKLKGQPSLNIAPSFITGQLTPSQKTVFHNSCERNLRRS